MVIGNVYAQQFIGALIFESVLVAIAAWIVLRARSAAKA
jgi:hypothetical protein